MARGSSDAGADGLVLFNRFYQPDFDLATLAVKSELDAQLEPRNRARRCSGSRCLPGGSTASLAATSGVETAEQVIKYLLVGADAVMTTSALLAPRSRLPAIDGHRGRRMARGTRLSIRRRSFAASRALKQLDDVSESCCARNTCICSPSTFQGSSRRESWRNAPPGHAVAVLSAVEGTAQRVVRDRPRETNLRARSNSH